jgi:hypothetical protein
MLNEFSSEILGLIFAATGQEILECFSIFCSVCTRCFCFITDMPFSFRTANARMTNDLTEQDQSVQFFGKTMTCGRLFFTNSMEIFKANISWQTKLVQCCLPSVSWNRNTSTDDFVFKLHDRRMNWRRAFIHEMKIRNWEVTFFHS